MADGFHALRGFLAHGELVAFVGAGLSKPGGLPLWSEFVQAIRTEAVRVGIPPVELADIDRSIISGNSIDALTELERHLGPASFARLVARHLDDRSGPDGQPRPVPDVVAALAELASGLRAVITTNLDAFVLRAFPREWQSFDRLTGDLASRRQYIFRIHGAVHDRSTWVLTRADYDRVMDRDPLYHTYFSAVFVTQPMVFVGFGLADPHFDRIAQKIRALAQGQPPHHFALVPEAEITPARRRKLGECGIELIGYPSHDALAGVLRSLMVPNAASEPGTGVVSDALSGTPPMVPPSMAVSPMAVSPMAVPSMAAPPMAAPTPSPPPIDSGQGNIWAQSTNSAHVHEPMAAPPSRRSGMMWLGALLGTIVLIALVVILLPDSSSEETGEGSSLLGKVEDKGEKGGKDKGEESGEESHVDKDEEPEDAETAENPSEVVQPENKTKTGFPLIKSKKLVTKRLPTEQSGPTLVPDDHTVSTRAWSAAVMEALNNMKVSAFASKSKGGNFKFQLMVCKDGKIKRVLKKGGSLDYDTQNAVLVALEQLQLPKPPQSVANEMHGGCAKIMHTFVWTASGVE